MLRNRFAAAREAAGIASEDFQFRDLRTKKIVSPTQRKL